ncbi:MAG: hypothetical protein H7274_18445 [Rhodoferax sp.]|nr:hypothetical protein [Rhodoferax sp.]
MSDARSTHWTTELDLCSADWAPAVARAASASGHESAQDHAFIALQNAYRAYGGLTRLKSLSACAGDRSVAQESEVEDLVAAGGLFGFHWFRAMWIPMFQIDLPGPTVATGPQRVVAELGRSFDGWALAGWFVAPNAWLARHSPIECLRSHLPDVLAAARADRYATTG